MQNYSTYTLSDEQYETLSYGLDTHFPVKVKKVPSIQNLKFSFKVYSRIFPTFQKMNYKKLKRTLEIGVTSAPKQNYHTNIEKLSKNYEKQEDLKS